MFWRGPSSAKIKTHVIAFAMAWVFSLSLVAHSDDLIGDCAVVSSWRELLSNPPLAGSSIATFSKYQRDVRLAQTAAAQSIYDRYFEERWGQPHSIALKECMDEDSSDRLNNELQAIFWRSSLSRLKNADGIAARLAGLVESANFQMFRLVGHFKENDADEGKGGFHRGRRSIFMDFSQIAPNDWLLIFAHELIHEVDSTLRDAVRIFNDVKLSAKVLSLARSHSNPDELSPDDRFELDRWLTAGLDRGLLAEVRAWSISFAIYNEGRVSGVFQPIEWLDAILANRLPDEDLTVFALRYLDTRFTNPVDAPFDRPLLVNELAVLRLALRNQSHPIVLGSELLGLLRL